MSGIGRGPFQTGPLSFWRFLNAGDPLPEDTPLPPRLALGEDDDTPPPLVKRDGAVVWIDFHDVACFRIDFGERTVTAFDVNPETTDRDFTHILNDHIAPRILAGEGELVLHASAVCFGEAVALFLGETGAGKSTLATSLHMAGHTLLGDDAMIVSRETERHHARAVYPSLRLYPETVARLLGEAVPTAPMADYSDKQHVHLATLSQTSCAPLPVAAMFFLAVGDKADHVAASRLGVAKACIGLIEQSFSLDPQDRECTERRLRGLSRLAMEVPAYRLAYPRDFSRLGEVHAMIETALADDNEREPQQRLRKVAE